MRLASSLTKQKLFKVVKEMPESFELENLFERLLFIKRLEKGIRQSDNGKTLTESETRRYLSR
ncbi:MAG: hypothetical protein EOO61_04775 [Hymenobacter sp.]|nr:MAG: hypothetical protein EOO61_04775 [Hymenobacter sp.]